MKRQSIEKLLSDTYPDGEMTTEKTEQMFPEVSDEKTKRIIDSGLRKIRMAESGDAADIRERRFVGAEIKTGQKKIRISHIIAVAACAAVCVFSLQNILKNNTEKFKDGTEDSISDGNNDNDADESTPGLYEICEYPEYSTLYAPVMCNGKISLCGIYSHENGGVLRVYDSESSETGTVCTLAGLAEGADDFFLSDDEKYLFVSGGDGLIKYDISSGMAVKNADISSDTGYNFRLCPLKNSSNFYLIRSDGEVLVINEELEITEKHNLIDPETDGDEDYQLLDAVSDPEGNIYLITGYAGEFYNEESGTTDYGIIPDSELVLKYDTSFKRQYTVPNTELSRIDSYSDKNLTVLRDGRVAVIGWHSPAGILSPDTPVIEELCEMPDFDDDFGRTYNTDICDFVQYTDTEMQLWNVGDTTPSSVYNITDRDYIFRLSMTESGRWASYAPGCYHITGSRLYYISPAFDMAVFSAGTDGTVIERVNEYSTVFYTPKNVGRNGDVIIQGGPLQSSESGSFRVVKINSESPEMIREYNCSNKSLNHIGIVINVDENILSETYDFENDRFIMELHAPDGRKICDFELPDSQEDSVVLSSRSTDSGEKIYYLADDGKAYCYDTETGTRSEMTVLNDRVLFCDNYDEVPEDIQKYTVLKGPEMNKGEKYDILMLTDNNELLGYNTETEELTVLADRLDSYGVDLCGFTVSDDGTIYCTAYDSNKLYRLVPEKSSENDSVQTVTDENADTVFQDVSENENEEKTDSSESGIYTEEDIQAAIDVVNEYFEENFKGCKLKKIYYAGDERLPEFTNYKGRHDKTEVIVLLSSFYVFPFGGDGSLNTNYTYKNWNWILVRNPGEDWVHVDHGY